jgi:transposase-like protein
VAGAGQSLGFAEPGYFRGKNCRRPTRCRRLRTSNPIERGIQQEIKRRTQKVRIFPNEQSLERLVSAVLVEIDDKWANAEKAYIKWECRDD